MSAVYFTIKDGVSLSYFFRPGIPFLPSCLVSRHGNSGLVLARGCKGKFRIYSAVFGIRSAEVHLTKDVNGG